MATYYELWLKKVKEDWSDAKFKKELIKQGIIIKKRTNKDA